MNLGKSRKVLRKVLRRAKSIDIFGSPVTLNVAGESTVTSWPGFLLTIAVAFVFLIYFFKQLLILTSRSNPNIT